MIATCANDIVLRSLRIARAGAGRRLLAAAAFGVLAAGLAAPPAGAQDEGLAQELQVLKRDLKDLQRFVYKGEGGEAAGASGEGGGLSGNVAGRLQVKIQDIQDSLREITGRIEEVEYRMRRLDQRVEKLASDVDFRLNRLEANAGVDGASEAGQGGAPQSGRDGGDQGTTVISSSGAVRSDGSLDTTQILGRLRTSGEGEVLSAEPGEAADGSNAAGPTDGSEAPQPRPESGADDSGQSGTASASEATSGETSPGDSQSDSSQSGDSQSSAARSGDDQSGGGESGDEGTRTSSAPALPEGTVQEQYEHAFSLLRQRDYAAAESAMREFVERHRDSELTGNAVYWLGETYYARGAYRDAAATFLDAYTKYPDGNKAPHSLLKLAMSLGALDKTDAACQAFSTLQQNPDAGDRVLRRAEEEAAKLGCS